MEWSQRVRYYRTRAGLTQEALAELFGVEPRTVRRWESGASRPPEDVRAKLQRAPVPVIPRATLGSLKDFVNGAKGIVSLYTPTLEVVAGSPMSTNLFRTLYGCDPIGVNILPYLGEDMQGIFADHGGIDRMNRNGLSSITADMHIDKGNNGAAVSATMRSAITVLTLEDGHKVQIAYVSMVDGKSNAAPCVTYGEEVRLEE
jgi:transcriptional regulator with XRE-family HTH domain